MLRFYFDEENYIWFFRSDDCFNEDEIILGKPMNRLLVEA
jgi:hypothetical protein